VHRVFYDCCNGSRIAHTHTPNSEDAHNLPGNTGYHCNPGVSFNGEEPRMLKWRGTRLKRKVDLDAEDLEVCS
jgi:hypothetical protein